MSTRGRLRAWLEIMRISNLPTVLSNAIAGATLGAAAAAADRARQAGTVEWFGGFVSHHAGPEMPVDPLQNPAQAGRLLAPLLPPMLAYLGGMVLNDAFDARIDARERPTRPIPSGRIARGSAFAAGFALLGGALAIAAVCGPAMVVAATAVLVLAIVVYDSAHAKTVASTLLLALCRALAALVPMLAFADGDLELLARRGAIALPIALAAWTLGLSLLARNEIAMRDAEARLASDSEAPHPCPACGQLMVGGHANCGECGRASSAPQRRVIARERRNTGQRLRALVPIGAVVLLLAMFFGAHVALLHRGRMPGSVLAEGNPGAAIVVAIVLALTALRAGRTIRLEPARTPDAIGTLIACLALVDAMALATGGHWLAALACTALFFTTRRLQKRIAGS